MKLAILCVAVCVGLAAGGLGRYFIGSSFTKIIERIYEPTADIIALWGALIVLFSVGWLAVHLWLKFK